MSLKKTITKHLINAGLRDKTVFQCDIWNCDEVQAKHGSIDYDDPDYEKKVDALHNEIHDVVDSIKAEFEIK